ncbi:DUF1223 domain-containing protein [Paraburkholderia pallida]|uniref:DUF1223 domain-containing protein n=1 Tax=Paraburkholderia pallida TaxID=2547399 RepID=UPI003005720C
MLVRVVAATFFVLVAPVVASARPLIVELFTSEGCSSRPPADAYLSELSCDHTEAPPLAFHVTHWNSLGWQDPYSLDATTQRQVEYCTRFGDAPIRRKWWSTVKRDLLVDKRPPSRLDTAGYFLIL